MKIINIMLSLLSISAMISVIVFHYLTNKEIPWLYVTLGSISYFLSFFIVISLLVSKENDNDLSNFPTSIFKKLLLGCHLSYLLIAGGTFLVTGLWNGLGILICSIVLGFITPILASLLERID